MDITAMGDGRFGFSPIQINKFKYKDDKKNGGISLIADKPCHVMVSAWGRDIFLEVVNGSGEVISENCGDSAFFVDVSKDPVTLRYKKLPDPKLTAAEINKARKKVSRTLCYDSPYSLGVPDGLADAIKWFQTKLAEIPKDCRESATINFRSRMEYGEHYDNIEIEYTQPETDSEVVSRVQIERERAAITEKAERAKLARLQKKYEGATPHRVKLIL